VSAPSPNRAFWSMAVEAQLYILFPLLLLTVRRWGAVAMVAAVTLVVAALGIAGPHVAHLDFIVIQSPPDLAALFAVGILTAGIVAASDVRRSWPWTWLTRAPVHERRAAALRCRGRSPSFPRDAPVTRVCHGAPRQSSRNREESA